MRLSIIKDPVPLIEKRRGLSPGGRFPPSFIHQVIIITGLNNLYDCMFSPGIWPQMPTGRKTSGGNEGRSGGGGVKSPQMCKKVCKF